MIVEGLAHNCTTSASGSCLSRASTFVSSLGWNQLTPWQKASEAPKRSVTPPLGPMTAHAAGRLELTPWQKASEAPAACDSAFVHGAR